MLIDVALVIGVTYLLGSWMHGASVAVLLLIWRGLPDTEGPPVLKLAMTTQWIQVAVGLFYGALSGRTLATTETASYEMTVAIGLGCVAALTLGLGLGQRLVQRRMAYPEVCLEHLFTFKTLVVIYFITLAGTGAVQQLSYDMPTIRQALVALTLGRLAVVSLVLRRLVRPRFRWDMVALLLTFEVILGFTGFFSGFKEPLLLTALALLEIFDRRRVDHWVAGGALATCLLLAGVMWMGVRTEFRRDFQDDAFAASQSLRLQRMQALFKDWYTQTEGHIQDVDNFVDRAWAIYYPALAIARVPTVLPHTDGALFGAAMTHLVTPRFLFPNKPDLPSDSDMVRTYSGVNVAGAESNTSIAFGYMAEGYVDFGAPLMFIPVFLFGLAMGSAYEFFLRTIAHRELAVSIVMCIFWINLYLFEKSWAKTMGDSVTTMVYVGGFACLLDRWLLMRTGQEQQSVAPPHPAYGDPRR